MKNIFAAIFFVFAAHPCLAQQPFNLIADGVGARLYYGGNKTVIKTAIGMLVSDSEQVADVPFQPSAEIVDGTVIIGIAGQEADFDALLAKHHIDVSVIQDKWEAFQLHAVVSGADRHLFVIGSDPRGAAYGVLELSRQLGVSPWVWWADAVPEKRANVVITFDGEVHAPSVQYRGIFLNDEDWALMPWSTRTHEPTPTQGAIGPKTYSRIFELLLRLRANTIWPAMHECTVPFYLVEGNREMAERYGIVISTSHAEPMMRTNTGEWNNDDRGNFNFLTNTDGVLSYWEERVRQLTPSENIYTIGMRGIHDGRMQGVKTIDDETATLQRVIKAQREMLVRNNPAKPVSSIPQIFVPYKEVLKAYDNGLELPDDVTLVWCDDNHGYITRLSNPTEQGRSGGAGVYYHVSYWGKPHDYLWLGSTQPGLIYAEMKRAWDTGARKFWMLNVGDIKPNEYLTEFFLDMAWNINAFSGNTIYAHQREWLKRVFGNVATDSMEQVLHTYYRLAAERKPDHMGWNRVEAPQINREPVKESELSPFVFGDEMERRITAYTEIANRSTELYETGMPGALKPAYFQLVHYPIAASAAMNRKILYAQKSRYYADSNPSAAHTYASLAMDAYREIAALDYTYNKDMRNGKWELMMDMKPRDLPVFQQPVLPDLPDGPKMPVERLPAEAAPFSSPRDPFVEHNRMIALNAFEYTNDTELEVIESLGHSGRAVRLTQATEINPQSTHLEYRITTTSIGSARIKLGTIPMHPLNGGEMRCAIVVDEYAPVVISLRAPFLTEKWAENVLRNQALNVIDMHLDKPGAHTIRIYAVDEPIIVDQLMVEFDLQRKHYLIPARR